jgi:hypothetical protein
MAKFNISDANGLNRAQATLRRRAQKIMQKVPVGFRAAMVVVHEADLAQLDIMVYSRPARRKRSGELRRSEKGGLRVHATEATISNDARSPYGKKEVYAWYVALGHTVHPGKGAAKRIGGTSSLTHARSANGDWQYPGRNWRRAAIKAAQHFIPLAMKGATAEAMRD